MISDLSLTRYAGFAALPEAAALRRRLEAEEQPALDNGVHLIVVQSADGSLIVGDSHHYAPTPDPFAPNDVDEIILANTATCYRRRPESDCSLDRYLCVGRPDHVRRRAGPDIRLVVVTGGNGASTAFAIAEEVIADLFDASIED